jgi:hypothetical protein
VLHYQCFAYLSRYRLGFLLSCLIKSTSWEQVSKRNGNVRTRRKEVILAFLFIWGFDLDSVVV